MNRRKVADPGTPDFLTDVWRMKPALFRAYVPVQQLDQIASGCKHVWARPPAKARIFVSSDSEVPGGSTARAIPSPSLAIQLFEQFRGQEAVTLLFNHVEATDPQVRDLQDAFNIPYSWRKDNVVATFSTVTSGIGYHAGHEDGFIVQVAGKRRWRVWSKSVLSPAYLKFLLADNPELPREPRPSIPPLVDCVLAPGDVLYIPALFPHEGVTIEESISLSLGWKGISTYHVLLAVAETLVEAATLSDASLDLIPDFLAAPESIGCAAQSIRGEFLKSGIRVEQRTIEQYLGRLVAADARNASSVGADRFD